MMNSWIGMTIVLIVFCTLLIALRTWQRKCNPDPELLRKLFHLGMGVFTLTLPWLFADSWPVVVMCGVTVTLLIALRISSRLQYKFGAVLGGVARCSHGEIYFSLGVATLFVLAKSDSVVYVSAILVLTFADAAAALVGKRFGRHQYQSLSGQKSIEGSLTFLLVATVVLALSLLVGTTLAVTTLLLLAVTLAWLLTLLEAMVGRGLDNLLIPLATYFLLHSCQSRTNEELCALLLLSVLLVPAFQLLLDVRREVAAARRKNLVKL